MKSVRPPRPFWAGLEFGPALVVLDWADRSPVALPAAWSDAAQDFQVAWCATPGPDAGVETVEDVLETLADRRVHTEVVADARLAEFAAHAAGEFPHIVRSLLLVGPGGEDVAVEGVRVRRIAEPDVHSPLVVEKVLAELAPGPRIVLPRTPLDFGRLSEPGAHGLDGWVRA